MHFGVCLCVCVCGGGGGVGLGLGSGGLGSKSGYSANQTLIKIANVELELEKGRVSMALLWNATIIQENCRSMRYQYYCQIRFSVFVLVKKITCFSLFRTV